MQRLQPAFAPIKQQIGTRAAPAIRWYSDAPAAEAKKDDAASEAKTGNNEVAQLKEQLEKKDKEIIDFKVRCAALANTILEKHTKPSTRTNTFAQ